MAAREPVSAAILCGGAGRMGGTHKGELMVGGRSILDRQLDALRPLTPDLMLIDRDGRHADLPGVRRIRDLVDDAGALGGIYTALATATASRVLVVACDMPFLTTPFLAWLSEYDADADVVIPVDQQGRHPLCGVFHRRIAPALKARIEARALRVDDALAVLDVRGDRARRNGPLRRRRPAVVQRGYPGGYAKPRADTILHDSTGPRSAAAAPHAAAVHDFSLEPSALPAFAIDYPPNRDLGDLGSPVAFELAKRLRKAPRAIAQEIAAAFGALEGVTRVAAAPNGYLNVFLDRPTFLVERLTGAIPAARPSAGKAIVEHTAINPNKAAHHGHLPEFGTR